MIASSPTTAAPIRASPVPAPPSNPPPHRHEQPANPHAEPPSSLLQQQQQQQHPQSPKPLHTHRLASASSACNSSPRIEQIQSAFRRQTVDAGTQYSRSPTPSDRLASATHSTSQDPGNSNSDSNGPPVNPATTPNSRMQSTSVGSKRNTPDTSRVLSASVAHTQQQQSSENEEQDSSTSKRHRPEKPAPKLLPRRYEDANPRDLVILISSMLMELIRFNDEIPLRDGRLTRFHSRSPPRISVQDYLQRLTTHATLSPPILLSMVYYIDRLCALYPAFTISSLTVHRFLISSATVASKGLSDSFWTNKTYARVGGITIEELSLLELDFLWRVEWRIVPQPEVLVDYYLSLVGRCDEYALQPDDDHEGSNAAVSSSQNGGF